MQALVDNLLDSARLATGGVQPQLHAVGYDEVLAPALASVDAGHLITVQVDETVPPVLADPGLLERVIANPGRERAHRRPRPRCSGPDDR